MTEKIGKSIQFVIGGCRSGKSRYALNWANSKSWEKKFFLATCQALDHEMEQRIQAHQSERGKDWHTIEEPIQISNAIQEFDHSNTIILIDCLTLWISNLLLSNHSLSDIVHLSDSLIETIHHTSASIICVSNEVGYGIVPDNSIARMFRDAAGIVNQKMASCANQVVLTVAGIPQIIKNV